MWRKMYPSTSNTKCIQPKCIFNETSLFQDFLLLCATSGVVTITRARGGGDTQNGQALAAKNI